MHANRQFVLAALVLAMSASAHVQGAENGAGHHHHGQAAAVQQLQLDAGKPWETDRPLRQAMGAINAAMNKALPLIDGGGFGDADYAALATTISQQVAYAVEHCKLAPEADAMLHLVLADLMAGVETMEGRTANPRREGAVQTLNALHAYGQYFQHPGWEPPRG